MDAGVAGLHSKLERNSYDLDETVFLACGFRISIDIVLITTLRRLSLYVVVLGLISCSGFGGWRPDSLFLLSHFQVRSMVQFVFVLGEIVLSLCCVILDDNFSTIERSHPWIVLTFRGEFANF